jgi:lysophospholipase L1-like esterase
MPMLSICQRLFVGAALCALTLASAIAAPIDDPRQQWIASWATSPQALDPDPEEPLLNLDGQTVRQRVRLSIGGKQLRVRLTNECGSNPVGIGSATVAFADGAANVRPESLRVLKFSGRSSVTIAAGAPVLSDPVDLEAMAGAELSISLYIPARTSAPTLHAVALKRAVVSSRGDFSRADSIEAQASSESSVLLGAVLVPAQPGQRLVVALGDSITDGAASTVDTDRSWPSALARRLNQRHRSPQIAIVNQGIAGNRLLYDSFGSQALGASALARFDRDVLSLPGVTHVVVMEGLNDIGFPGASLHGAALAGPEQTPTADTVTDGYRQLIARAHARGVKAIGATLTPFEGVDLPAYYSASKEATRQAINNWIRTSGAFDGIVDFDAMLRDPNHPHRMQTRFNSGDWLHPNDAGYQAMSDAIDAALFE